MKAHEAVGELILQMIADMIQRIRVKLKRVHFHSERFGDLMSSHL